MAIRLLAGVDLSIALRKKKKTVTDSSNFQNRLMRVSVPQDVKNMRANKTLSPRGSAGL